MWIEGRFCATLLRLVDTACRVPTLWTCGDREFDFIPNKV